MINRAKLEHILEYAKQQRHIGLHCKVPPEDMVEIVEAAMLQGADGNSPVIRDGWVMVPAEPTEEMCDVGHVGVDVLTGVTDENEYYSIYGKYAAKVYRAMIAAAPKQEA